MQWVVLGATVATAWGAAVSGPANVDVDGTLAERWPSKAPPPPSPQAFVSFNNSFGDSMVLQRDATACFFGMLGTGGTAVDVALTATHSNAVVATGSGGVEAVGDGRGWKACLDKTMPAGGSFTVTATCTGCTNSTPAVINEVTFGDVWYCAGQVCDPLVLLQPFLSSYTNS